MSVIGAMLLFAAGCDWPMPGFDGARTGFNPAERTITVGSVGTLREQWVAPGATDPIASASVVIGHLPYGMAAFDRTNGTPRWRAAPGFSATNASAGDGRIFLATNNNLFAYDADTCARNAPTTCSPVSIASLGGAPAGSPAISDGRVYVSTDLGVLAAFSTATTECDGSSPAICRSQWLVQLPGVPPTGDPLHLTEPAVGSGRVVVSSDQGIVDAVPVTGGVLPTNEAEWTADLNPTRQTAFFSTRPTIAGGLVYVGWSNAVYVFAADGSRGCTTVSPQQPKLCTPLFRLDQTNPLGIAVFDGRVYTTGLNDPDGVRVYDADGVSGCSGAPKVCHPLWTNPLYTAVGPPVIANGVVYVMSASYDQFESLRAPTIQAFDAGGTTACGGNPKTCNAVGRLNLATEDSVSTPSSPIVVDGAVYASTSSGIHAFGLPAGHSKT